jgi:hypothetical protein
VATVSPCLSLTEARSARSRLSLPPARSGLVAVVTDLCLRPARQPQDFRWIAHPRIASTGVRGAPQQARIRAERAGPNAFAGMAQAASVASPETVALRRFPTGVAPVHHSVTPLSIRQPSGPDLFTIGSPLSPRIRDRERSRAPLRGVICRVALFVFSSPPRPRSRRAAQSRNHRPPLGPKC